MKCPRCQARNREGVRFSEGLPGPRGPHLLESRCVSPTVIDKGQIRQQGPVAALREETVVAQHLAV